MNGNNIQFQYKPRREERPSRYIMERALGLSPNSYKHQLSSQLISRQEEELPSQRNTVKNRNPSYYQKTEGE